MLLLLVPGVGMGASAGEVVVVPMLPIIGVGQ